MTPRDLPELLALVPKSVMRARQRAERAVTAWSRSPESQEEEPGSAAQKQAAGPAARQCQTPAETDAATSAEMPTRLHRDRKPQRHTSPSRPTDRIDAAIIRREVAGKVLPNVREDLAIDRNRGAHRTSVPCHAVRILPNCMATCGGTQPVDVC